MMLIQVVLLFVLLPVLLIATAWLLMWIGSILFGWLYGG